MSPPMESAGVRAFVGTDYETAQQHRILRVLLLATLVGALFTAVVNALNGWTSETLVLLALSAACLAGFGLLRAGRDLAASLTLCLALLLAIDAVLFYGAGLHDTGIVAYPLFMLCVTFLLASELALVLATVASVVSVLALYLLEAAGKIDPGFASTPVRAVTLCVLLMLCGLVLGAVRRSWAANIRHVQETYELTLEGWARALEYRDGETAGHTRRVAELSMRLARRLKCSERAVVAIRRGAWLHDIGKMAIPDQILLKPGPLTPEECEVMKTHTSLGREFVSGLSFLDAAAEIPSSHHEQWDGSGYPDGLSGEQIPLAARIFAVVDNWDALQSDRPYRKAWPRSEVVAHLNRNSGTLFDPRIVEAFLELVGEGGGDRSVPSRVADAVSSSEPSR